MHILMILAVVFFAAIFIVIRLFSALKQEQSFSEKISVVPVNSIHQNSSSNVLSQEDLLNGFSQQAPTLEINKLKKEVDSLQEKKDEEEKKLLDIIEQLKQENALLQQENKDLKESAPTKIEDEEIFHLRAEISALRSEVSQSHEERDRAIQDKEFLKADFDRKINEAKESLLLAEQEYAKKIASLQEGETNNVFSEDSDDASRISLLEEEKARLIEKNEFLQQELTKSKIQISGLQRICDNLQKQNKKEEDFKEPEIVPEGLKLRGLS